MFCYMLVAAAGLTALFKAVPLAYDAVRWAGVLYLLWLACRLIITRSESLAPGPLPSESNARLYRRGLLTCLLNPKIVVTYGALLPQFVDPAGANVLSQTVMLGLVQIAAAACAHSLVIVAVATLASVISKHHAIARLQRYLLACVLAALAVRLAMERRSTV
jgi:threonine/homoserine/homoserine lactone efflux protein